MKSIKRTMGAVIISALSLGLVSAPAAAHQRSITTVYGTVHSDATSVNASLNRTHAGTMKMTLFKRVNGSWTVVDTKRASELYGSGMFTAAFPVIAGDKTCKAKARFTAANHVAVTKMSELFDC